MRIKLFSLFLNFAFVACALIPVHGQEAAARAPGVIKVAKVTGEVTAVKDGKTITLATGAEIAQGYVVNTAHNASAVLAFSNGATINLAQDSSLSIDEFLQDPFADEVSLASMTAEPSVSTTKLNLSRGELVGNVKKLNADAGSSFTVQTPVGAAGIRGTTFRIVFRPDGTGKAFFSLTTVEGNVVLASGTVNMPSQVAVSDNREVAVQIEVTTDPTTGISTVTAGPSSPVIVTIPPPTTLAQVVTAVQQTVQAVANVVFTTPAPTNTGGTGGTTGTSTGTGSEGETPPTTPPPPPAP
ncbi:MAG: FecR domain-containing protein, partial [Opitutaceae bacterium]|nr:FecR domain-containing protein [Opitutaceae bacterium]